MSERLTRRELKKDEFLEAVTTGVSWAKAHMLVAAGIALALVLAVMLAFRVGGSAKAGGGTDPKAEKALSEARVAFSTGGLPAGIAALDDVRAKHGGSTAGREATFLLGNALYEAGEFERAKTIYAEYLKRPLYDDLLIDGAKFGIAGCQEELGNLAEAAKGYDDLWLHGQTPGIRAQAAIASGRCREGQGDRSGAAEKYQAVVDAYPSSPEALDAKFALEQLQAGGAPGVAPATPPQG